jgi:hypothetical protein
MSRHTHPTTRQKPRRHRRPADVPVCSPKGKKRYRDKKSAIQVLQVAQAAAALDPDSRRRESRTYRCPDCNGWHLTSQPLRAYQGPAGTSARISTARQLAPEARP